MCQFRFPRPADSGFNGLTAADVAVSVFDNDFTGLIPPQTTGFSANAGQAGLVRLDCLQCRYRYREFLGLCLMMPETAWLRPMHLAECSANDWLISTPFDLDTTTGEVVSFMTRTAFSDAGIAHPEVRFRYSTDYSGIGDRTVATWTELPYAFPAENSATYTPSAIFDISGISGSLVWFAFQYTSFGNGAAHFMQWRVDDFSVSAGHGMPDFKFLPLMPARLKATLAALRLLST